MTLTKANIDYRDNQRTRINTRALVAILAGLFLTWKWVLIAIAVFSLGESFTMYKVLSHSLFTGKEHKLSSRKKGELSGEVFVYAFIAMLSTMTLAAIIKSLKYLITTYLF